MHPFNILIMEFCKYFMEFIKQYGTTILALFGFPLLAFGLSWSWKIGKVILSERAKELKKMKLEGPPLILGKSLTKKDQIIMDLLNTPEHLPDCWVLTDPAQTDDPIIFASPGFCFMTGYKFDEIVGRNCRFLQGEGTDRNELSKIKFATEHEAEASVSILNYRKDGTPFNNQFFITPLHAEDGTLSYHLGMQQKVPKMSKGQEQQCENKNIG